MTSANKYSIGSIVSGIIFGLLLEIYPSVQVGLDVKLETVCHNDPNCQLYTAEWPPQCHHGKRQSPIDLPSPDAYQRPIKKVHMDFHNYGTRDKFYIRNNGDTIMVQLQRNLTSDAYITGYGLGEPYIFAQAHFHWGDDDNYGSEHTIRGRAYSMEMHFVHYSSRYNSIQEALPADGSNDDPFAIAVVAVFLDVRSFINNEDLAPIVRSRRRMYQETPAEVNQPLDLEAFLPSKLMDNAAFYRYDGSLTTPNCTESVIWTVFEDTIPISHLDVRRFRTIMDENGNVVDENFRPTQPRNERPIKYLRVG